MRIEWWCHSLEHLTVVVTFVMKSVSFVLGFQPLCIIFVLNVVFLWFFFFFFVAFCALGHKNNAVI